jgi:hypothetical protein
MRSGWSELINHRDQFFGYSPHSAGRNMRTSTAESDLITTGTIPTSFAELIILSVCQKPIVTANFFACFCYFYIKINTF